MTTSLVRFLFVGSVGFAAVVACVDTDGEPTPAVGKGGSAGTTGGGSGRGGRGTVAGNSGKGGEGAEAGTGGVTTGGSSGRGGGAGRATHIGGTGAGEGGGSGEAAESGAGTDGDAGRAASGGAGSSGTGGAALAGGSGGEGGFEQGGACSPATIGAFVDFTPPARVGLYGIYIAPLSSAITPPDETLVALAMSLPDPGLFRLGAGDEANYATCKRCLVAWYADEQGVTHRFFPASGTLDIDPASEPLDGVVHAILADATFVEVDIDPDSYISTPVPDGACLSVASASIDVPNDSPDGSGGAGNGEGGAPNIPDSCIEVTVSNSWAEHLGADYAIYLDTMSPNLGTSPPDRFLVEFYGSNEVGSFTLGEGIDETFAACERCVTANVTDGTTYGRNFFAVRGSLDIDAASVPLSGTLDASLTDVTLLEVTDSLSEFVPGGECLHLASASLSVTP